MIHHAESAPTSTLPSMPGWMVHAYSTSRKIQRASRRPRSDVETIKTRLESRSS
jgi:hypothetical protein